MTRLSWLSLFIALCLPQIGWAADEVFQLQPVTLDGYEGDDLKISYEMPCGGSYYGVVTRVDQEGKLRLGAVIRRPKIGCARIPDRRTVQLDFVATRGFKVIAPMKVSAMNGRFKVLPVSDVRRVANQGQNNIEAVVRPRCGKPVGAVLRRVGAKSLQVGFVERFGQSPFRGNCPHTLKSRTITSVHLRDHHRLSSVSLKKPDIARTMYLRIAPVRQESIKAAGANQSLQFVYRRLCNEAPVGVVVDRDDEDSGPVKVGMLVARYMNYDCGPKKGKAAWVRMTHKRLKVPANTQFEAMKPTRYRQDLAIKTPVRIGAIKKQEHPDSMSYFGACDRLQGVVYASDRRNNLAVGVLVQQRDAGCKRGSAEDEVSLAAPLLPTKRARMAIVPMRIKGQSLAH